MKEKNPTDAEWKPFRKPSLSQIQNNRQLRNSQSSPKSKSIIEQSDDDQTNDEHLSQGISTEQTNDEHMRQSRSTEQTDEHLRQGRSTEQKRKSKQNRSSEQKDVYNEYECADDVLEEKSSEMDQSVVVQGAGRSKSVKRTAEDSTAPPRLVFYSHCFG